MLYFFCCDAPGEAHASAVPAVVSEDSSGDDLTEGLQHFLQLLFIHRQRQIGNVKICGVLLLLLLAEKKRGGKRVFNAMGAWQKCIQTNTFFLSTKLPFGWRSIWLSKHFAAFLHTHTLKTHCACPQRRADQCLYGLSLETAGEPRSHSNQTHKLCSDMFFFFFQIEPPLTSSQRATTHQWTLSKQMQSRKKSAENRMQKDPAGLLKLPLMCLPFLFAVCGSS